MAQNGLRIKMQHPNAPRLRIRMHSCIKIPQIAFRIKCKMHPVTRAPVPFRTQTPKHDVATICRHSPDYAADSLDTATPFPAAPSSAPFAFALPSTSAATQPAAFSPSDLAVAQLTSLLSLPDQPVFKSLLDGFVKKIIEDGLFMVPDLSSNPQNDGSADKVLPRDIPCASVESGDGSLKTKGKGKAKADAPPRGM
ncbi:hypothetical protein C8R44DRAFT_751812 [Mycena epipterygia]|nr:hypothetical protein C8R44DRAFT_751812 [Mycena epipterygia]